MEENKPNPGQALSQEQVESIAGGDGTSCPAPTTTVSAPGVTYQAPSTPGDAIIAVYEGFVDVTSHIIDRIASATR